MYSSRVNFIKFACYRRRYIKKLSTNIVDNVIYNAIRTIMYHQERFSPTIFSDNGSMICEPNYSDNSDDDYIIFNMSDLEN